MHYIEFNNFEVDILDSCNFDYDKEDRLMLNCGHMIICYLSLSANNLFLSSLSLTNSLHI